MTSLTSSSVVDNQPRPLGIVGRFDRWLNAMPHPAVVLEIGPSRVAVARWAMVSGSLDSVAVEALPVGALMPSPIDTNVTQPDALTSALRRALNQVPVRGAPLALLVPDPVVRVFILPFENLPRNAEEALPLLRWRLKKSVPFDVDETAVSWMRQRGRDGSLEIVAAIAQRRILREYEEIVESAGAHAGVVLSSTLASLPLLEERGSTLLTRLCGKTLTAVIVRDDTLCVYRSTEMPADAGVLDPRAVLDEVFPAIAYYQDTWEDSIDHVYVGGFGAREGVFRDAFSAELRHNVESLSESETTRRLGPATKDLLRHGLDGLVGWQLNEGS